MNREGKSASECDSISSSSKSLFSVYDKHRGKVLDCMDSGKKALGTIAEW